MDKNSVDTVIEGEVAKMDKLCSACEILKPIASFHRKGEGFDTRCKTCISKLKKSSYKNKKSISKKEQHSAVVRNFYFSNTNFPDIRILAYQLKSFAKES